MHRKVKRYIPTQSSVHMNRGVLILLLFLGCASAQRAFGYEFQTFREFDCVSIHENAVCPANGTLQCVRRYSSAQVANWSCKLAEPRGHGVVYNTSTVCPAGTQCRPAVVLDRFNPWAEQVQLACFEWFYSAGSYICREFCPLEDLYEPLDGAVQLALALPTLALAWLLDVEVPLVTTSDALGVVLGLVCLTMLLTVLDVVIRAAVYVPLFILSHAFSLLVAGLAVLLAVLMPLDNQLHALFKRAIGAGMQAGIAGRVQVAGLPVRRRELVPLTADAEDVATEDQAAACCICFVNLKTHTAVPCGHTLLCNKCTKQHPGTECPLCKGPLERWIKVYS